MEYHLSGKYSQYKIIRKHEISSRAVFQRWIKHYNSHKELKNIAKGKTKQRITSWEEQIQIVLYSLENDKNFQMIAEMYDVFY
ncbi:hypothetical protein [Bacillus cereus]|uniref:hypothetical protein n=1 Tax=Bacillus cereus TaxID=1396 RepID=UPI003D987676